MEAPEFDKPAPLACLGPPSRGTLEREHTAVQDLLTGTGIPVYLIAAICYPIQNSPPANRSRSDALRSRMADTLDPAQLRDITDLVFTTPQHRDAHLALDAINRLFGGCWSGATKSVGGVSVTHYEPSGLAVHVQDGMVTKAWAPMTVPDSALQQWRQAIEKKQERGEPTRFHRNALCTGPVRHRWDLLETGIILYPVPADAPRPRYLAAMHPAVVSMTYSSS